MVKFTALSAFTVLPASLKLAGALWFCLLSGGATGQATEVKHFPKGFSPAISAYLTDVLQLCLEETVQAYGPYRLQLHDSELSSNRSKLETERGVLLDVLFATNWLHQRPQPDKAVAIEFPVFFGTLGLRSLIVNKPTEIVRDDAQGVVRMRAGLGVHWMDNSILEANGIQVVDAQTFGALFPMLDRGRFDYLPLSVLEAQQTLRERQAEYPTLGIDPTVKIFYPLPAYLYINAERTDLVERITAGLRQAQENGALTELFLKHFQEIDQSLRTEGHQVIVLQNPYIQPEHNQRIIQRFLDRYGTSMDLLSPSL